MDYVCKVDDDFIDEKPRWIVDLSNGERIYQDDNRPGMNPPQAWLRLRIYLAEHKLNIVRLLLQFRSHFESPLPENAKGYFFMNKLLAFPTPDGTMNVFSFLVGYFDGKAIQVQEWQLPELMQIGLEQRDPNNLQVPECLILNGNQGQ